MDVVHALDASAALKNDLITAATIQDEVTLSGTVSSDASKQLAESIAAHVDGVTKVHNNLQIGNPGADAQSQQPAPGSGDMPDPDQSQAQRNMAGLPPPGPAPDANPQDQGPPPGAANNPQQPPYPQQPAYPQQGGYPQQPAYPQQGGYPPPPPARPQYQSPQNSQYPPYPQYQPAPQAPAYQPARGPVTIPAGTLLQVRTSEPVDSKRARSGEPVQFTVIQDVIAGGVLAVPRGAIVHGVVTEVKNEGSGHLAGSSVLALALTSLDLGGQSYPLDTDQFRVKGPNKAGQTVSNAAGGALIGAIIGCAVGRGAGCAIGAGIGAAGGTAASAASGGPRVWIPAEALVTFHLNSPITVAPVSPQEAARLAALLRRIRISGLSVRLSAGLLPAVLFGRRSVLLAVIKSRDQGKEDGHPPQRMPVLRGAVLRGDGGATIRARRAIHYNGRVVSNENCASAGTPRTQQIPCCRPPVLPCPRLES
jgi:hypothetical protein